MKWETYKQLNAEQKEEYNFKQVKRFPMLCNGWFTASLYLFAFFYFSTIIAKPELLKDGVLIDSFNILFSYILVLAFVFLGIDIIFYIYYRYKGYKWLKQIGVK